MKVKHFWPDRALASMRQGVVTIGAVPFTLRDRVAAVVSAVLVGSAGVVVATDASAASSTTSSRATAPSSTVWLCRPGLASNPCESSLDTTIVRADGSTTVVLPKPARHQPIDCFYVYPTVSDQHARNADLTIDPAEIAVAEQQASRFSQVCRVFAPMYRQITIQGLLRGAFRSAAALEIGYTDVLNAWRDYLAHDNHGRGVVFIGHSQGTGMLTRLLRNEVDPTPVRRRQLVSALLIGGGVTIAKGKDVGGSFHHIPACRAAKQTGCVVAYSSFDATPPSDSLFGRVESSGSDLSGQTAVSTNRQVLCVNPANLEGGSGELVPYFGTKPFPGMLGVAQPAPKGTTSWVQYPNLYTATCTQVDGATWLQIDHTTTAGDKRPLVQPRLGAGWGLHLVDVNIALGNLVDLVRHEAKAYRS
jgi:hypothetical protein